MRVILVLLFVCILPACGARVPARNVTMGVIDAIDHPDPRDPLAVKTRKLAERYVDSALGAGPPKGLDTLSAEVMEGMIKSLGAHTDEERMFVRALVSEAIRASLTEVEGNLGQNQGVFRRRLLDLARTAQQTTGAAVGSATEQLLGHVQESLGSEGRGPLTEAVSSSVQRTTAAAVEGATEQLATSIKLCQSDDPRQCQDDLVRRISRSAAIGITEGVGRPSEIWPLGLTFGAGVICAALGAWVFRVLARRRSSQEAKL